MSDVLCESEIKEKLKIEYQKLEQLNEFNHQQLKSQIDWLVKMVIELQVEIQKLKDKLKH